MASEVKERDLVLEALLQITRDGEYSHLVLKDLLDIHQYMDKRERAFVTRVVNGTLEHMIEIDYIIDQVSKVKVKKMKPVIRNILRSGVYQLKYMDSVPDAAVCNEAVKLAEKRGFRNLKGFVNGVLRNISRNLGQIEYPDDSDPVRKISVCYSIPEWIVRQWLSIYGVETVEKIAADFLKEKPLSVRFDPERISGEALVEMLKKEGVSAVRSDSYPCALYLSEYDHLAGLSSFQQGYYQVQDVSSMQVAAWADPKPGDEIIDVCAAPGGKAIHLAELLKGTGRVEARDLTDYKVHLIEENVERSGLKNIDAVKWDAREKDPGSCGKADILVADLPCSGLGVLGKKPDLRYKMTEKAQQDLIKLQREILSVVKDYVKPGGKLLYSTCTISQEENEKNTAWFAAAYPQFELIRQEQRLPGIQEGDGFYIAMFRREDHE